MQKAHRRLEKFGRCYEYLKDSVGKLDVLFHSNAEGMKNKRTCKTCLASHNIGSSNGLNKANKIPKGNFEFDETDGQNDCEMEKASFVLE